MVQLVDSDIRTRELLGWKGVHVLHFIGSSCSQKLRIFLNLKGIEWESHLVDLFTGENFRAWFLGINPRVNAWVDRLRARPEFAREIAMPPESVTRLEATHRAHAKAGKMLEMVAEF
jgi:hypothetical protein